MKKTTTYLTILFLLLVMSSCGTIQRWVCGTEPELEASTKLPDTALCTKDATTLEQNYITLKNINTDNENDNRIISFTYQQMMGNLRYLIAKAKEKGIEEEELGFRVYFGAKKEESFNKGQLKSIIDGEIAYSTVFFVATLKGASEDENDYTNIYEIPALNYGGSRRPPDNEYKSDDLCPVHGKRHITITD